MFELIKAISLLIVVGSSLSGAISLFLDWNLLKFGIGTAIGVILQIAIKWYIDRVREERIQEIISDMPPPAIKMQIECAYCKNKNVIDYNLLRDEFECSFCKNPNSIYGKFYAARKVTPLDAAISVDVPDVN